jgi:O-antigen/teichoic acid export membrane protein
MPSDANTSSTAESVSSSPASSVVSESTFRPAVLLMVGRAFASAATLLIPITLVRVFDQADYGTYKQLFLVFATLYSIALVGLSDSLYYFVPREPAKGGRYVANAIAGLLLAGIVCLAGLHASRQAVAGWLKNPVLSEHLDSIGLFLLFSLSATVLEIALIARKRYGLASGAYVISDVVRAACFVVPMLVWPGLGMLMLWAIAFAAARLVAALVLLKREFGPDLRFDRSLLAGQLAYAMPFALYVLVEILQSTFHQYAVSWSFDAATFAIYSVGCFQVPFVDFLATPASSVMMVRMTEELREGRPAAALGIWLDITRKLALVFFPMVALLMITSREVITLLFTAAYAASAPIFALWVTTIALSVLQTDGVMRVQAQVRFLFLVNLLRLGLVVALIRPFMQALGLLGPVLVTLVALVVAKGLHLWRMQRVMGLRVGEVLPWKSLVAVLGVSAVSAVPVAIARAVLVGPPVVVLLAECAIYGVTYVALLFAAGLITPEERAAVAQWVRVRTPWALAPSGVE